VDLFDSEASWGKSSRGWFKGFKLHTSVNQQGLPLRAKVTPANCYDSPILPDIAWDLKATYLLADAGYDSKLNRQVAKSVGAVAVIAKNRRKSGKNKSKNKVKAMYSELLRAKRYLVEQFNGHFKANLLKDCYLRPKGLAKKSAMVYAALISYVAEGLRALLCDETSLKSVSKYWA
jgi:IS5 family transposase